MIDVKVYREGDAQKIARPKFDPLSQRCLDTTNKLACSGVSFTLFNNEEVYAVGGVAYQWKDCYFGWVVVDERVSVCARAFTRVVKYLLSSMFLSMNLKRVNVLVDFSVPLNVKWAKMVGLEYEYIMKGAGPSGSDVIGLVYKGG